MLFFGFSFFYSLFLYGFVILLANDPIPPYVVNNTLIKTDSKLDHIIKLKNVCSSIFSRKRTSRKNITFLVSSIESKPYVTGNSDTGKKTRSSLKINRHVGSIRPKPTSLYSNANRNHSVTIFSERFTLPTKAGSVSYKNTYPHKRRSSLLRFSQDRTRPTTAVPWAEDKSDNVTASDSNFTEDYSILTNQVPTTVSTNLQGSFEIGSSFVCNDLGIVPHPNDDYLKNSQAYIQSWLKVIEEKPNTLFAAIKDAEKICDYILDKGEYQRLKEIQIIANEAIDNENYQPDRIDEKDLRLLLGKEYVEVTSSQLTSFVDDWSNGKKNRGCVKYKTVPTDYRLSIDRTCLSFKRTYALRTECERYNSRFKASGQERLWVRNGNSVANLNTLAHISALAVALAAVLSGSHSYRAPKSFRRGA